MEKRKIRRWRRRSAGARVHGHRGHVESDRNSFSKNWAEK